MNFNFQCPKCGCDLKYDIHDGKQHCPKCRGMFTFEIKGDKFIVRKWRKSGAVTWDAPKFPPLITYELDGK